jgi:hypothetical protein
MTICKAGQRIRRGPGVKLAFERSKMLDRPHQSDRPPDRTIFSAKGTQSQPVPAHLPAAIASAGDQAGFPFQALARRKLERTFIALARQNPFCEVVERIGVFALGKFADMRHQQQLRRIEAEIGDIGRGANDESLGIELEQDIPCRLFKKAVQDTTFGVAPIFNHLPNAPGFCDPQLLALRYG